MQRVLSVGQILENKPARLVCRRTHGAFVQVDQTFVHCHTIFCRTHDAGKPMLRSGCRRDQAKAQYFKNL